MKEKSSLNKVAILQDRAEMLAQARTFFKKRNILEVDCPIITCYASVDAHIDLIPAAYSQKDTHYLHSSPEYGMKRLLSQGIGDIYQLSHVFRDGECGKKHNPEFTMAEWYRIGFSFSQMMEETVDFIRLFVGDIPFSLITYRDAFKKFAGFDYLKISEQDLLKYIREHHIETYPGIEKEGKDALLNVILGVTVEPNLGLESLCVLAYYPATQCALAKTRYHGEEHVAERFEVYFRGIELANGYHELTDAKEQRQRFIEANELRGKLGKNTLPIDEHFLQALEKGLPQCCGVAVGFDRLMMLRHHTSDIADVLPFDWSIA